MHNTKINKNIHLWNIIVASWVPWVETVHIHAKITSRIQNDKTIQTTNKKNKKHCTTDIIKIKNKIKYKVLIKEKESNNNNINMKKENPFEENTLLILWKVLNGKKKSSWNRLYAFHFSSISRVPNIFVVIAVHFALEYLCCASNILVYFMYVNMVL